MDDLFAEDSGDIYFYSPEQLDPDQPGSARTSATSTSTATARVAARRDPRPGDRQVDRMQISPDGSHAAFRHRPRS